MDYDDEYGSGGRRRVQPQAKEFPRVIVTVALIGLALFGGPMLIGLAADVYQRGAEAVKELLTLVAVIGVMLMCGAALLLVYFSHQEGSGGY